MVTKKTRAAGVIDLISLCYICMRFDSRRRVLGPLDMMDYLFCANVYILSFRILKINLPKPKSKASFYLDMNLAVALACVKKSSAMMKIHWQLTMVVCLSPFPLLPFHCPPFSHYAFVPQTPLLLLSLCFNSSPVSTLHSTFLSFILSFTLFSSHLPLSAVWPVSAALTCLSLSL